MKAFKIKGLGQISDFQEEWVSRSASLLLYDGGDKGFPEVDTSH